MNLNISSTSPGTYAANGVPQSPLRSPQSPRSPLAQSPTESRSRTMDRSNRFSGEFTGPSEIDGGGGLGNLADELANAWDEDGEGDEDVSGFQEGNENDLVDHMQGQGENNSDYMESTYEGGLRDSQDGSESDRDQLHPLKQKTKANSQRHRRQESKYDGSDYGNDSDFEDPGDIPPGLEARMAGIESLVRWSAGEVSSSSDELVNRVIDNLRDLGGQTGIENSASRYVVFASRVLKFWYNLSNEYTLDLLPRIHPLHRICHTKQGRYRH